MSNEPQSLSNLLLALKTAYEGRGTLTFGEIVQDFEERGFGFFLFVFALPAALPLPAVGYGTVLGLPLILIAAQMAVGKKQIWFPENVKAKAIKETTLDSFADKASPWVKRLEVFIRPRLGFITYGPGRNLIGLAALIMAISVLIPLPFTNTVPSMGIALMGIGRIMHDGLAMIAGILIGLCWIALLIFFGVEGVEFVKDMIKSFL